MNSANEVRVSGGNLFSQNKRIGHVYGNDDFKNDGIYTVNGEGVYRNGKKVGYACGNGDVRLQDGTLWKYL